MPWEDLEPHYRMMPPEHIELLPRNPVTIILDNIRSAYNTGSVFRTSDAGAVEHIHLCGMTAYPPNAKLGKTALGAYDYVPWTHHRHTLDALDLLQGNGVPCVAVEVAEGAVSAFTYPWPRPVALIFGNEVTGIAPEILERADAIVDIPMMGHKNSINVASAFGIVLFEVLRNWKTFNQ